MAAGYLEILRARHAARLLVGTLVGRLPNATAAIAIVLFVRAEGGTYSLAGALAAVYGVANAVGQPLLGRLVDLYGQPRVQLPAALVSAFGMGVFAFAGTDPPALAYAAVAWPGCSRLLWRAACGRCGPPCCARRSRCTPRTRWTPWRRKSCSPSGRCW